MASQEDMQSSVFETREEIGTGAESAVFLIKTNGQAQALKVYTSPPVTRGAAANHDAMKEYELLQTLNQEKYIIKAQRLIEKGAVNYIKPRTGAVIPFTNKPIIVLEYCAKGDLFEMIS